MGTVSNRMAARNPDSGRIHVTTPIEKRKKLLGRGLGLNLLYHIRDNTVGIRDEGGAHHTHIFPSGHLLQLPYSRISSRSVSATNGNGRQYFSANFTWLWALSLLTPII